MNVKSILNALDDDDDDDEYIYPIFNEDDEDIDDENEDDSSSESVPLIAISQIPLDPSIKTRIDIDANVDLRCILSTIDEHDDDDDEEEEDDDDDNETIDEDYKDEDKNNQKNLARRLRKSLHRWNKAQKIYQFPINPLSFSMSSNLISSSSSSSSSSLIALVASLRQQLRGSDNIMWTMPLESDQDMISIIKRRKLQWQESLYNVTDRLIYGNLNYFYIIATNEISSSIITSTNISGYFFNEKNDNKKKNSTNNGKKDNNANNDNNNNNNNKKNDNNFDVSCILVGVSGPFLQRLHSLQVEPLVITDKETLKSSEFSKMNLDKQTKGCTGAISVRIVIDVIIEDNFSLSKTSKITLDIPTIICRAPFSNSIQKKLEIANTNCKNIFDNDNNDENHRISLIGYILPESIQALASLLQLITCIHAVDRGVFTSVHLQPYRYASFVESSGIDDKIVGITNVNSSTVLNAASNLRQPKQLIFNLTSIPAITAAYIPNFAIKKNVSRSLPTSSSQIGPLYQYNMKFQINSRLTVFSYLNPNVTILKTKNINDNNEANDEVNHDINFISNAIILTSIRYHVDRFTANQLLSNDTEMDINNYTNGNNKKRDRTNIGNDINIINDTCKVAVYNDKLYDGYLIIYDNTTSNIEKQEEILKSVKEYTIYAD